MQTQTWEYGSFMSVSIREHRISALGIDVRKDDARHTGLCGSFDRCVFFFCECLIVKMGMGVNEFHLH
jgi:hypothetical protein